MKKKNIKFVAKVLSNAGIECEVDIQNGVVLVEEDDGPIDSYGFRVEDDLLLCFVIWKDRVSKKALPKVLDLIEQINKSVGSGYFAVDPKTGVIMSAVYRPHSEEKLEEKTVLKILARSKKLKTGYEMAFQSVMSGEETPAKAMKDAEKKYLSSLSISELLEDMEHCSYGLSGI